MKIEKYSHEEAEHVAWPIDALELKEVEEEIKMLLNGPFVTTEEPRAAKILSRWGPRGGMAVPDGKGGLKELRGVEMVNRRTDDFGTMFNDLSDLYKYNVKFWFIFYYL